MKNILTLLLPFLFSFLTACDAAKMLIIKVKRNKPVSAIVYGRESLISRDVYAFEKRVVFRIPTDSVPHRKIKFFFGLGPWNDKDITRITGMIDSIVINNSNGRLALTDEKSIVTYLTQHHKGVRATIRIKVK